VKTNLTLAAYVAVICFFSARPIQAQITITDYSRVDRLYAYAESPHDNRRNDALEEDLTERQYQRAYDLPTGVAGALANLKAEHQTSILADASSLRVPIFFSIDAVTGVDETLGNYFAEVEVDMSFRLEFAIDQPMDFRFSTEVLGFEGDRAQFSFYEKGRGPAEQLRGRGSLDPGQYILDISVSSKLDAGFRNAGKEIQAFFTGDLEVVPITPVPEPTTYAVLFATGCLAYGVRRRFAKGAPLP
jgi:hypothetical protein